ncbi:MAG: hypothetical protein LLG02_03030 [Pelosinus sp.]|nr:hypothetical protein [Pelosinus sp.]
MLIATEFLGSVGVGVTAPQFFRANDGEIYVVKLKNNQLGGKVLASELLAAKIGSLMNLCFPSSQIIEINEETLQKNRKLTALIKNQGKHFASRYLPHTNYVSIHNLRKAANISEMAGILLFDHMFHNPDRAHNRKNLLIRKEDATYKLYAIDNSHLFRSGRWTIDGLNKLSTKIQVYSQYSFGVLLRDFLSTKDFIPYIEKVKNITTATIEAIFEEIPNEWLPLDERQALLNVVKLRCTLVDSIAAELLRYMQQKHH